MNIYIANIPFKATENDVKGIFESYGQVASIRIVTDKETQKSRGFGFVIMNNDNEANAAIDGLNGYDMMGKQLSVSEAKPKESRPEQGRRSFGDRPQGDRPFRPQGERPQGERPQGDRPQGAGARPFIPRTNPSDYNPAPPSFMGDSPKPFAKTVTSSKDFKKEKPDRAGDAEKKLKKEAKNKKYNRFTDDEEETEWKFGKY